MSKRKGKVDMLIPTIIMGVIALCLVLIGYFKGGEQHISGLKSAFNMTIKVLPLLIFAFIVAGMIQTLLPKELLSRWIGIESGFRGILFGAVAGGFSPGSPYVSLPVALALLRSGASIGTMVAFLTGWSLWAISRLPLEVGILGWKFTLIRFTTTFLFPPIAGLLAHALFSNVKL